MRRDRTFVGGAPSLMFLRIVARGNRFARVMRRLVHAFLLCAACVAGTLAVAAPARAADPLTWVAPVKINVGGGGKAIIRSVSCPTANLCLAAGAASGGNATDGAVLLKTTNPRDPSSWEVRVFPESEIEDAAVWCASASKCFLSGAAVPSAPRRAVSTDPAGPLSAWTIESAAASSLTCASESLCLTSHFFTPPGGPNFHDDATVNGPFGTAFTQITRPAAASQFPGYSFACGRASEGASAPCLGLLNTSWMVLPAGAPSWAGGIRTENASSFGAGVACGRTFCAVAPDSGFINYLDLGTQSWTLTAGESGYASPELACTEDPSGDSRCVMDTGDFGASRAGIVESSTPRSTSPADWRVTYGIFGSMGSGTDIYGLGCATSRTCVAFSFDGRVSAGIAPEAPAPTPTATPAPGGGTAPQPTATPAIPAPGSFTITLAARTTTAAPNGNALFDMVVDAFASIGLKGAQVQKATKGVGNGAAVRASAPKKPAAKTLLTGTGKAGADGKARVLGKLTKTGRALLRKNGKLKLKLTITATSPSGKVVTTTADVTIRPAKKKR
jgi:hypothetical protein